MRWKSQKEMAEAPERAERRSAPTRAPRVEASMVVGGCGRWRERIRGRRVRRSAGLSVTPSQSRRLEVAQGDFAAVAKERQICRERLKRMVLELETSQMRTVKW